MTHKKIIAMALGVLTTLSMTAAPRTATQAVEVARSFAKHINLSARAGISSLTPSRRSMKGLASDNHAYYIVNVGEQDGFIVVSGDDRFKPVLGYATEGHISADEVLPDGLQYWLTFLSEEMEAAILAGYEGASVAEREESVLYGNSNAAEDFVKSGASIENAYSTSVSPLLTTKWNQNSPYNNRTPNFATGCVATGIAQVMNFWKYPVRGTGSHTNAYFPQYSADFAATTYDWANMKDVYGGRYDTKAEVDAVSTLMFHLGVATDMRWTADNSGTPNMYGAYALINFFGYNKNLYAEGRDYLSLGAWKALILDQLYSGHPLCYSGMTSATSGAGHFFVLDGYDASTGKFHFNWGWGGAYDGYFDITALEPGGAGQAGALSGSYNYYQQVFVNVQPTETGDYVAHYDAETVVPVSNTCKKQKVVFHATHLTNNALSFTGTIGLAIYDANGKLADYVASPQNFPGNLNVGSSYSGELEVEVNLNGVADGQYVVCVAAQHQDHKATPYPVRAFYGRPTYYNMTVAGDNVTFVAQKQEAQVEEQEAPAIVNPLAPNTLYQNVVSTFQIKLKNVGAVVFCDEVGVCIQKGSRDSQRQYITTPCRLMPGEEKTITLSGKVLREPGQYKLIPCFGDNGSYNRLENQVLDVTIQDEASPIDGVRVSDSCDEIYTLQGVRVDRGAVRQKGMYILGGKKVIIK